MERFFDVPMRRKLYTAIAAAVGVAVAVAAVAVAIYEYRTFRPRTLENAETQAGIMAELLVAPMLFHDTGTTDAYLATLRHWPELSEAILYDSGWNLLSRYTRDAQPPDRMAGHPLPGASFGPRKLIYVHPVMDNGHRLGYLAFHLDLRPLLARLPQYGIMLAVVSLSLLAVSTLLAFALKYAVTAPITALAATAKSVTENRDYSLRAATGGGDEVGDMTRAFNQMLDTLEERDRSLRESRHLLQSVIDSSAALIFVKDLEGRYMLINRRFEEIYGISNEAVQGRFDADLFPHGPGRRLPRRRSPGAPGGGPRWKSRRRWTSRTGVISMSTVKIPAARRLRESLRHLRSGHRHHPHQGLRGAAPAKPEDGGHRPPGRRHRPRLQQPPHRHQRVQRPGPARKSGRIDPLHGYLEEILKGRRAGRRTHPPAAGLQPQADPGRPGSGT